MALNSKKIAGGKTGPEQPLIDPGVYPARIVQILDLGLQPQRPFQGKDKPPANEIMFTYELVDSFMVDEDGKDREDKPRWLSETIPLYSLDQDKAKSTKRYEAADPDGVFDGDFSKLIDIAINVSVVHNKSGDKTYTNVANTAAMRAKDAAKCPALVNPSKVFDCDEPDMEVFKKLPEWIQEKIKSNLNYNGSKLQKALGGAPKKEQAKKEEAPEQGEEASDEKPWD